MTLTPREVQVIGEVACGHSCDEVAEHLGLRPSTVRTYLKRIYHKIGACNAPHAVYLCMRAGLIGG